MNGTVHVAVHSVLRDAKGGAEEVRIEADGICREVNGRLHIRYEEPGEDGAPGTMCHLAIGGESVEVVRRGAAESHFYFANGEDTRTEYKTPFGTIPLEIKTSAIAISRTDEDVTVQLAYTLCAEGNAVSECVMTIAAENV